MKPRKRHMPKTELRLSRGQADVVGAPSSGPATQGLAPAEVAGHAPGQHVPGRVDAAAPGVGVGVKRRPARAAVGRLRCRAAVADS